jgi:histidine triad (HIT) family protein
MGCVFCGIVQGTEPAEVIDEDEDTVSFLDIAPFTRGHTLVVPRAHTEDLWSADEQTAAAVMRSAHRVAALLRDRLRPDGLNLLQATREIAFQTVFHLHVHVIPRYQADTMVVPSWPKGLRSRDELAEVAGEIRDG